MEWVYDQNTNQYARFMAGQEHRDAKNNTQLVAKSIIVQFTPTSLSGVNPDKGILDISTVGEGRVLIFQDGQVLEGKWKKDSKTARTIFLDNEGNLIRLVGGVHWFEIVKTDTTVSY